MSMTRTFRTGAWIAGVLLAASVAFAQTPPSTQPSTPQTPSTSSPTTSGDQTSSYASPVTITGCVQRADSSASGTGGSGFVLRSTGSSSSSSSPSSTTPATPSSPSTTGQQYQLMAGSSSVQLADHVGHQVEVMGTLGPAASSPTSGTTTGTTGSTSGTGTSSTTPSRPGSTQPGQATSPAASNMGMGTTFNVTSVRMISASCPQ